MDLLITLLKTAGYLVSLGLLGVIAVLYVLAFLGRIPWPVSAAIMVGLAFATSYSTGVLDGIERERMIWQMEQHKVRLKAERDRKEIQAKLDAAEIKYLQSERLRAEQSRQHDDELNRILNETDAVITDQQLQIKSSKKGKFHAANQCQCNPYAMRADPRVLRNLQAR